MKVKHPEMPKKPLTPYFRFFMRKRVAYAKKHPDMSVTELTKELSKKYGSLAEHKKVCTGMQYLCSAICNNVRWK
jgi:upstream-binding transcription factor